MCSRPSRGPVENIEDVGRTVCGIVMAYGTIDPEKCERMLARIHHRGPDDTGRVHLEHAWLGHQPLSIMDVTGGKQPIADETGSAYVVGNGEIYNHEAIRDQLSEVRFATDSDTESAFRLVLRDGSAALHDLRGMFALAMACASTAHGDAHPPLASRRLRHGQDDDRLPRHAERQQLHAR